jgi:HEAT repeats
MKPPGRTAALFLFVALLSVSGCRSAAANIAGLVPQKLTVEEFNMLDWQRQVEYLEAITRSNYVREDNRIIGSALVDDDSAVIVAALESIWRLERDEHLPKAVELTENTDPIIRWRALLVVEKVGSDDELIPTVARMTSDREWMVREAAYRTLRNYKKERKEKTYFYSVLFKLNEKNPQVVAEIYRTLVWYDDESAWPYLIKRSYHCKSASELILVMRELARTKTRDAQVRLKTLTRSQSVIVRTEAGELLREYF